MMMDGPDYAALLSAQERNGGEGRGQRGTVRRSADTLPAIIILCINYREGKRAVSNYPSGYNEPEDLNHYLERLQEGEPCHHPGCLSHVTHPCEGCGRVAGRMPMKIGWRYNWKGQPERLIYIGKNWSGNGYWHQFEKVGEPGVVWCEVLDSDLPSIEETK